jgi:aclacinomycin oxidase
LHDRDDLIPLRRVLGSIQMTVQIDAGLSGATTMVTSFVSAETVGSGLSPVLDARGDDAVAAPTTWPGTGEAGDMLIRRYELKARWDSRNVFRHAWPSSHPPDRSRSAGG